MLAHLKWGFGNKLMMFLYAVHEFKKEKSNKLYIVQQDSQHDSGTPEESFLYIFPKLREVDWLEFISWKKYDSLKEDNTELEMNSGEKWFTNKNILDLKSFIKTYMKLNPVYKSLDKKYDFSGLALHIRYGDKLSMNRQRIKKGLKPQYVVLKPEYYIDHAKFDGPIYIFTDSPDIVRKTILPHLKNAVICDEKYPETFYLLTKIRHQVISDSTMSICAGYFAQILSTKKFEIVAPDFVINVNTLKLMHNLFHDDGYFIEETNKKYIL